MKNLLKKIFSLVISTAIILTAVAVPVLASPTDTDALEEAYLSAKAELETAKSNYDSLVAQLKQNAAFYEDFEGATQKVGYRSGGSSTKLTPEVASDNGNKYGKVTVNEGHAQSGYYGVLDATPVTVNNTDNYKVIFDYKITGTVNNNIRFYRTSASSSTGVGEGYLNDVGEWKTFEHSTPKYSIDTTVFYLQITGSTPAGTEICIDNFMVLTPSEYESLNTTKTDYKNAVADYETAKDAYEASLSTEELAYIKAKEAMNNAKDALDTVENETCVFVEDYEGATNKMGHRQNGNDTFDEQIITDGDNKYAKITVNEGAASSSWYGVDMDNGATNHSKFAVEAATEYYITFKYKTNSASNVKLYRAITDITNATGANTNFVFVESNDWNQASVKIKTADTHSEYFFYFQLIKNTGVELCIDDIAVVSVAGYDKLMQARTAYGEAVADFEAAEKTYNHIVKGIHDELTHHDKVDATCKDTGKSEYWSCTCGKLFADANATNEVAEDDLIIAKDAKNHTGGTAVKDRVEATEFEAGYTGDTYCLGCDGLLTKGEDIAATHKHTDNLTHHDKVDATCKETGKSEYWSCTCEKLFTDANATTEVTKADLIIPKNANNHAGGTTVKNDKPATEFEAGYTGDTYCLGCDGLLTKGEDIAATHKHTDNLTHHDKVDATCKETGKSEYWSCTCEKLFTDANATTEVSEADLIIPKNANNHTGGTEIKNAQAENCGENGYSGDTYCKGCDTKIKDGEVILATGNHTGGTATCTAKAECTVCFKEYGEKNANNHTGGTVVRDRVEATEFEAGYTGDTYCKSCDTLLTEGTEIPANHTHSLTLHEKVEPTCTNEGNIEYWSCSCGKYYSDENGTTEISADELVLSQNAENHSLSHHEEIKATTDAEGKKEHWSCECGKLFLDGEAKTEITENELVIPQLESETEDNSDVKDENQTNELSSSTDDNKNVSSQPQISDEISPQTNDNIITLIAVCLSLCVVIVGVMFYSKHTKAID